MSVVLDSSMCLTCCIPGQANELSVAAFQRVQQDGASVPWIWHIEMANIFGLKKRDGKLTSRDLEEAVRLLTLLDIRRDPLSQKFTYSDVLSIMRKIRLTGYDATYVYLALRTGLPLATFDREMKEAARQAGVAVVTT